MFSHWAFAAEVLWSNTNIGDETTWIYALSNLTQDDIRTGNIGYDDIPMIIVSAIEVLLVLVGTICVVAIIYHAVRMQFFSGVMWDSSWVDKAKKWIYSAMIGFVLSMSSWFIMTKIVAIFAGMT